MRCAPAPSGSTRRCWPVWSGSRRPHVIPPAVVIPDSGLSGQLLPLHGRPQADELLSSWLTRLSLAHGLTLHAFGTNLWPAPGFWERDIDRCAILAFLTVLGWKTATSPQ